MNRRKFLCGVSALGTTTIAGCFENTSSESGSDVEVREPTVRNIGDDWELISQQGPQKLGEFEIAGVGVTEWHNRTKTYEYIPIRERFKRMTLGEFEEEVFIFFASRIDFKGTDSVGRPRLVQSEAATAVTDRMREMGLQNVHRTNDDWETMEVNGNTAIRMEFSGDYVVKNIPFEVDIPKKGKQTFQFDEVRVPIKAVTALWKEYDGLFLGGGAFPNPDDNKIDSAKRISITGRKKQGIDVTIDLNLMVNSSEYVSMVESLIRQID